MSILQELQATIDDMVDAQRGILAADESTPTITKRFATIDVESNEKNRRQYRSLLLETPELGQYISGVILFEETLGQRNHNDTLLADIAAANKIVPGIKVDKGTAPLPGAQGDKITFGLDGLSERLAGYKSQGARFAKWREVYPISHSNPTQLGLTANAETLARYAATCQNMGVVPIVEPEVLMDGDHAIERCQSVVETVLHEVFYALYRHGVSLENIILKPSMVTAGKGVTRASPEQVAELTLRTFLRCVPAAVPSINFLSGGQTPIEATENLNAINQVGKGRAPWQLSLSFGRALQEPVLKSWQGKSENVALAQQALLKRARLNSLARRALYESQMELD